MVGSEKSTIIEDVLDDISGGISNGDFEHSRYEVEPEVRKKARTNPLQRLNNNLKVAVGGTHFEVFLGVVLEEGPVAEGTEYRSRC